MRCKLESWIGSCKKIIPEPVYPKPTRYVVQVDIMVDCFIMILLKYWFFFHCRFKSGLCWNVLCFGFRGRVEYLVDFKQKLRIRFGYRLAQDISANCTPIEQFVDFFMIFKIFSELLTYLIYCMYFIIGFMKNKNSK